MSAVDALPVAGAQAEPPAHPLWEVPVALYRAGAHGRFIDVNQAMVDLMG